MGTKKLRRIHAYVSGIVQGVYFRASTRDEATRLGLSGWVRNLRDRRVELEAEGAPARVEKLVAWLHVGPSKAEVEDVAVRELDPSGDGARFEVRY